jgi:putative ABC transport system permease protein
VPANAIIKNVTSIANVAQLPVAGGVILVIISMLLTLIAGLIPARLAAKKDPVVALRSE